MYVLGRRFVVAVAVFSLVGMIPVMMAHPSGVASAGLSAGFMVPTESVYHVLIYLTIGLWGAWLGREAMILLPFACLVLLMFGAMVALPVMDRMHYQLWMLACMLFFALLISVMRQKYYVISAISAGAVFYYIGLQAVHELPAIAPPIYFILGMILSVALLMAIGASVGLPLASWGKSWLREDKALGSKQEDEILKAITYEPKRG